MPVALAWLSAFALYLRTACPTQSSGDTAELFLAGHGLDLTHPPGYALLACLVRLALLVPAGGVMFRATLVAAAAGAAAVALLFRTARRLGAGTGAALAAAAWFGLTPLCWWQSTMLEKYALQLALAAWVLGGALPRDARPLRALFAAAVALTHHSIAVFLAPVAAVPLWRARRRLAPRTLVLALTLGALPLSLKAVYPGIRSPALHAAGLAGAPVADWCEPYQARALWDYLRVKFYAARLAGPAGLERAGLRQHLGYFRDELSPAGVALGLAGWGCLALADPPAAAGAGGAFVLSAAFNSRFVLPPVLAGVYHQTAFLLLALGAALAAGAATRRLAPAARAGTGALAAAGLLALAAGRWPARDAGRHFTVYDFNRAQVAAAPPGAVFLAAFDYDMDALRFLQATEGLRPDLIPLQVPHRVAPGQFVVRRRYRPWAASLLPGAVLNFSEEDSGFTILRRLVTDNAGRYCFAISGLSVPAIPPDLFAPAGNFSVARAGRCPVPGPSGAARRLRRTTGRSRFGPAAALGVHRTVVDLWAEAWWRAAAGLPAAERLGLLRERARLIPGDAAAWIALADAVADSGDAAGAARLAGRAVALDPASPDGWLALIRRAPGARDALAAAFTRSPFGAAASAPAARAALARGRLDAALPAVHRALAEVALAQAAALPGNPEVDGRRLHLLQLAAALAPSWADAPAAAARALQDRARWDEADAFLGMLPPDAPGADVLLTRQADAELGTGRAARARARLEALVRREPAFAPAWFYLGQAELAAGDPGRAARAFARFLELDPGSAQAPAVRQVLDRLARRTPG